MKHDIYIKPKLYKIELLGELVVGIRYTNVLNVWPYVKLGS